MRLWTHQDSAFLEELDSKGEFRCQFSKAVHNVYFDKAYRWLTTKLEYANPPCWLWPGSLNINHLYGRDEGTILLVDIPEDRVTLLDFGMWHSVLNNDYLARDEEDWDANSVYSRNKTPLKTYKSWDRLLDPFFVADPDWYGKPEYQAVIEVLYATDVEARLKVEQVSEPPFEKY